MQAEVHTTAQKLERELGLEMDLWSPKLQTVLINTLHAWPPVTNDNFWKDTVKHVCFSNFDATGSRNLGGGDRTYWLSQF